MGQTAMKKLLRFGCLVFVIIVVLIGVLTVLGGRSTTTTTTTITAPSTQQQPTSVPAAQANTPAPSPPAAPETTAAPEPTVAPTPIPAVGQDVRVGDVRWKVLSAENMGNTLKSDNQFTKPLKTSGFFVKVRFEIENLSKDMLSYGGADLVDDKGRTFKHSSDALFFIPQEEQSFILSNLNPNVPKTVTEIYEVSADATGLKFKAGDLKILGNEEALIDLGL
jgi:hypothetical protein